MGHDFRGVVLAKRVGSSVAEQRLAKLEPPTRTSWSRAEARPAHGEADASRRSLNYLKLFAIAFAFGTYTTAAATHDPDRETLRSNPPSLGGGRPYHLTNYPRGSAMTAGLESVDDESIVSDRTEHPAATATSPGRDTRSDRPSGRAQGELREHSAIESRRHQRRSPSASRSRAGALGSAPLEDPRTHK